MKRLHVAWVFFVAGLFLGISGSQTFGQTLVDKDIEQRLTNQTEKISEGVKSKQLAQEEANILQNNLSRIRGEGVRFQEDGKLTSEEKTQLNKMLDQNNQMIQDKKKHPVKAISISPKTASPTPAARDPEIKEKIANQQKRIDEGIKSQQLSLNESKILQNNLNKIQEEEAGFRVDGKLTKEDKDELLDMLEDNDKMIRDKKNNPVKDIMEHKALSERNRTIPQRIDRQHQRIDNGIKNKKLTSDESKVLIENLDFVQKEEARLSADKKLTAQEQKRLHTLLDQNSAMIDKKKDSPVKTVK